MYVCMYVCTYIHTYIAHTSPMFSPWSHVTAPQPRSPLSTSPASSAWTSPPARGGDTRLHLRARHRGAPAAGAALLPVGRGGQRARIAAAPQPFLQQVGWEPDDQH